MEKVEEIISPFKRGFPVLQFAASDLEVVKSRLEFLDLNPDFFNLKSYPDIRNCQLLVPCILGTELIVAIDDDEVVPPDFLEKAGSFAGRTVNGTRIDGVAGFYYYKWGTYRVKEPPRARTSKNLFDRKSVLQNESYDLFMSKPGRLIETSITLGGNMVFSRELFYSVPFDPRIPRGEDIDYMINSRMLGFKWMMDKELRVDHFPPHTVSSRKLQEDVIRFVYEKRKVELSQSLPGIEAVYPEDLDPYPGEFLKEGVEVQALEALRSRHSSVSSRAFYKTPEAVLVEAKKKAAEAELFFSYVEIWPYVLEKLEKDQALKDHLLKKLDT